MPAAGVETESDAEGAQDAPSPAALAAPVPATGLNRGILIVAALVVALAIAAVLAGGWIALVATAALAAALFGVHRHMRQRRRVHELFREAIALNELGLLGTARPMIEALEERDTRASRGPTRCTFPEGDRG